MVKMFLFGREVIYSSEDIITADNLITVLNKVLPIHFKNAGEIDYLYRYYRGDQPILYREKTVRPEINNKIVENRAYEIVAFKTGYVFGEPIQYVRRSEDDSLSEKIGILNDFMFMEDKSSKDKELAEWFNISGTSYRMVLPSDGDTPFQIATLDPRNTFVVYNQGFGNKPLMGVTYITLDNLTNLYSVYTPTHYYEVVEERIVFAKPHSLGYIPIIEYPANNTRLGCFEIVITLLDALNKTASNRLDGLEQFIQAFMKFVNCDIDEEQFLALKDLGAIKIKGEPGLNADVDIVSKELNQTQAQVIKDDLYRTILTICGVPDRNGANRTTGDTGQAVILRDGWSSAESRARDNELMFKKSEKQFLRIVLKILSDSNILDLKISDIDIKFTRNKTDNLLVKTQGLQNMLEAGIHPQIAIANSGLFSDPEQTFIDSQEYLEKWKTAQAKVVPGNNKPNVEVI